MSKISLPEPSNMLCPQTLFLYGTCKDDGSPNFGLFSWFSYVCNEDRLGVMACIGEPKLTKDLILKNRVFSANLVTRELLPAADFFGNNSGRDRDKVKESGVAVGRGEKLNVPIIEKSPWIFELEVAQVVDLTPESTLLICRIQNTLVDERIADETRPVDDRLREMATVRYCNDCYYGWDGNYIGKPGELQSEL